MGTTPPPSCLPAGLDFVWPLLLKHLTPHIACHVPPSLSLVQAWTLCGPSCSGILETASQSSTRCALAPANAYVTVAAGWWLLHLLLPLPLLLLLLMGSDGGLPAPWQFWRQLWQLQPWPFVSR